MANYQVRLCSACGASVTGERCSFCGTAAPPTLLPSAVRKRPFLRIFAAAVFAFFLVLVIAIVASLPKPRAGSVLAPRREVTKLLAQQGDICYVLAYDDKTQIRLRAINVTSGACLWETEGLGDNQASRGEIVLGESSVFWILGDSIQAFDLTTGRPLWLAKLTHNFAHAARVGSTLLTLEKDGTVQAWSGSGKQLWSHRFSSRNRHLLTGSGRLLLLSDERTWALAAAATGKTIDHFSAPDLDWVSIPNGCGGISNRLAYFYSLEKGHLIGTRSLEHAYLSLTTPYAANGDRLWWTQGHALNAVSPQSVKEVFHTAEDDLRIVGFAADRVVLATRPDWDPTSWSLICEAGGHKTWTLKVHGKSFMGDIGIADWAGIVHKDAVLVIQLLSSPRRLAVERVSLANGKPLTHQEVELSQTGFPGIGGSVRDANRITFTLDGRLFSVDLATGEVANAAKTY